MNDGAQARNVDELLALLLAELRGEFGDKLLCVILAGSAKARGPLDAISDIDLFVVVATNWFQRRFIRRHGADVDLFIDPPPRFNAALRPLPFGNVAYLDAIASGDILIDETGLGQRLVNQARRASATPRSSEGSEADLFMMRLRARNLLEKTRAALHEDMTVALYLLSDLIAWAPQAALIAHGQSIPSPKVTVRAIRERFPTLYDCLQRMLEPSLDAAARLSVVEEYYCTLLGDAVSTKKELIGPRAYLPGPRRLMIGDVPVPMP